MCLVPTRHPCPHLTVDPKDVSFTDPYTLSSYLDGTYTVMRNVVTGRAYLAGQHCSGHENLSLTPLRWSPDTWIFPMPPRQEAMGQDQHGAGEQGRPSSGGSCCPVRDCIYSMSLCVLPSLGERGSGLAARAEQMLTTE